MTKLTIGTARRGEGMSREIDFTEQPDGTYTLGDKGVPRASIDFLLTYGIKQYVADGAASAKTVADFIAGTDERLRKIVEADFARTKGEPGVTNDPEVLAAQLSRADFRAAVKANEKANAAYKAKSADERKAMWEKSVFGPNGVKYQSYLDEAAKQIKAREKVTAGVTDNDLGL